MSNKNQKTASENKNKHSKKHKRKKDMGAIPYFTTPLTYCLIALIVILPMFISFVNLSVKTVHNAQQKLTVDFNDIEVNTDRFDNNNLVYDISKLSACEKVGVLKCDKIGLSTDVYFGVNRVSMRSGVGLSSKSSFDDYKSKLDIAGYSTAAFKGLHNISKGDILVFETTDKVYEYKVISNKVEPSPDIRYSSGMILSCDEESKAFSAYNSEKRYVVAEISTMRDKKGA